MPHLMRVSWQKVSTYAWQKLMYNDAKVRWLLASTMYTKLFSQAGMREEKASFEASLWIELFARVPKTRLNTCLQELWHEREREPPPKWVKHKKKLRNTKIRYENTANLWQKRHGWTLKRIIIVVFQHSFSKFVFFVCCCLERLICIMLWGDISLFDTKLWTCHFQGKSWL